jgi:hypothetical protein
MPTLIIHMLNEDPVLGEVDEMPARNDVIVILKNPRRRDGKDLLYLDPSVSQVIYPLSRVNFIEIMPVGEEEEIVSFVRE